MARALFLQDLEHEFHGVMYISAMLKSKGHDCDLYIETRIPKIIEYAKESACDVFAFSFMSGTHHWVLNVSRALKKEFPGVPVIYGGAHATFFPEIINEEPVDIVCVGEGEYAMLELMDALDAKADYSHVRNLWVKNDGEIIRNDLRPLVGNLDDLPIPDRSIYFDNNPVLQKKNTQQIMTSRGCPYSCTFCCNRELKKMYSGLGKYMRYHSPERVVEEFRYMTERYNLKTITIADDLFTINRKRVFEILDKYNKSGIGVPFFCHITVNLIDEEMVKALKEAGCIGIWFGLETGNEELRFRVLKKRFKNEEYIRAAELLRKHGIKFRTYNILGLPDETLENAFETVEVNIRIKTDYPWCAICTPYEKTEIMEYAVEKGYLKREDVDNVSGSLFKNSVLKMDNINEIVNLHRFFQTCVLWPWTFPIVRKIIRLPQNPLFYGWFALIYLYVHVISEKRGIWGTVKFVLSYIPVFFRSK